jgi:glycerol-3-phosphate acyltransferase PlsX
MRIVVDAMGGDHAPAVVVDGAVQAARVLDAEIVLVGVQDAVEAELRKHQPPGSVTVVHASQVIEMDEHPAAAVKAKKDSSMVVGMDLVKRREADAFVTAGNSGGALAAALFRLGRIRGIERPALSTPIPSDTPQGFAFILDIGATTDPKPEYLLQYAIMGSVYVERVMGVQRPRVAIVSNGEEEGKGNQLVQDTVPLLKASGLNFVGGAEGKDIPAGIADVIVTDGFTGNVIIKLAEGLAKFIQTKLEAELRSNPLTTVGGALAMPAFRRFKRLMDYREYGAARLLGVEGVVVVGHGRSDEIAIKNAILLAARTVENGVVEAIRRGIGAPETVAPGPQAAHR